MSFKVLACNTGNSLVITSVYYCEAVKYECKTVYEINPRRTSNIVVPVAE